LNHKINKVLKIICSQTITKDLEKIPIDEPTQSKAKTSPVNIETFE